MFDRVVAAEIEIEGSPKRVWQKLTAFEEFPEWNPYLISVSGRLQSGGILEVTTQNEVDHRTESSRARLHRVKPAEEMSWRETKLLPFLFEEEHIFRLEPVGESRTRLIQSEHISGWLAPLFSGRVRSHQASMEAMNRSLKARVEAGR